MVSDAGRQAGRGGGRSAGVGWERVPQLSRAGMDERRPAALGRLRTEGCHLRRSRGKRKTALWVGKGFGMGWRFPSPGLKRSESCGCGSCAAAWGCPGGGEDGVMREGPRGRARESRGAFQGLDSPPRFLHGSRFRRLLGASSLSGCCRGVTCGTETCAAIFMCNPVPTDTSLPPAEVLTLCCRLLFTSGCHGQRKKRSLPSPSPDGVVWTLAVGRGCGQS